MKTMAWRWTLAASALGLLFAACTVTSDDPTDTDGGTAGSGGGTAGTGGSTAGTGGGTAGSAGTAGTGGGSAGSGPVTCNDIFDTTDACGACVVGKCCTETEACYNDTDQFCMTALTCMSTCDAGDPMTCAQTCDDGNFNEPFNNLMTCMTDNCATDCAAP